MSDRRVEDAGADADGKAGEQPDDKQQRPADQEGNGVGQHVANTLDAVEAAVVKADLVFVFIGHGLLLCIGIT